MANIKFRVWDKVDKKYMDPGEGADVPGMGYGWFCIDESGKLFMISEGWNCEGGGGSFKAPDRYEVHNG